MRDNGRENERVRERKSERVHDITVNGNKRELCRQVTIDIG